MAQSVAIRRLRKEYGSLEKSPAPGALARPLESNFLHAHFLLHGDVFFDTPYEGGVYHGVLKFPPQYPMKPPTVIMRTPSGRFQPDKEICFSMSDFHPELWNPAWNIRTILTGLVSFMNSDEITTGGVSAPSKVRVQMAKDSLQYGLRKDPLAKEIFGMELEAMANDRTDLGESWPPPRPAAVKVGTPSADAPSRRGRGPRAKAKAENQVAEPEKDEHELSSARSNKNAAKNKKKREREKRRKLAKKFLSTLSEQVPEFVVAIETALSGIGLDVSSYVADHVCWRTETAEEYGNLVAALSSAAEECALLVESEVGGRSIATFSLAEGIQVGSRKIDVVEIPAPKEGSPYRSGLEHAEFVIAEMPPASPLNDDLHQSTFDHFMDHNSSIAWNTKARSKEVNPDISMKVELEDFGTCSVKFHLFPLSAVIAYEKESIVG